ncbi:MAG TPA: hypothetical protein VGJ66_18735 [Pyrinomonadaceae bacterium]|jgi:hypothetical protein
MIRSKVGHQDRKHEAQQPRSQEEEMLLSIVVPCYNEEAVLRELHRLGIVGEYVGRIYAEVKLRPLYVVRERLGFAIAKEPGAGQTLFSVAEAVPEMKQSLSLR